MSIHTHGPWKVLPHEPNDPYLRVRGTVFGRRYEVANVPFYEFDAEESIATANLIAAAPETAIERDKLKEVNTELLEALKALMSNKHIKLENLIYDIVEDEGSYPNGPSAIQWGDAVQKAKIAIAKAEELQ